MHDTALGVLSKGRSNNHFSFEATVRVNNLLTSLQQL